MTYQVPTEPFARGLLDPAIMAGRQRAVVGMQVAYRALMDDKRANYGLWTGIRKAVPRHLQKQYAKAGWHAPPLLWDAFWRRVDLPVPDKNPLQHVRLIEALTTDATSRVLEHCYYRLQSNGNVHAAFCGPTGLGKSSCAISLADHLKPFPPEDLLKRIFVNDSDLPRILPAL